MLLNYWYARQYDNLHINPSYFRQIPIFPADAATQAEIAGLVDALLAEHAALNQLREQGYEIVRRGGKDVITLPYDRLFTELQASSVDVAAYSLVDAQYQGVLSVPEGVDTDETVSSNIYVPQRYPTSVVLRHNKLWLIVPDADLREYLVNYLSRPRWRGKPWAQVAAEAQMPVKAEDRAAFADRVQAQRAEIVTRLDRIDQLDQEIDQRVLALYGITDPSEQARVLGSAPIDDEAAEAAGEGEGEAAATGEGEGEAAATGEAQAGQAEGEE